MSRRVRLLVALILTGALFLPGTVALADGDPGSDVLVYQNLFAPPDAGLSIAQQAQLGELLTSATRAGAPIRVAIIASPSDLGAYTALWRKPRSYAQVLGIELSLEYRQRLLVVMPNGYGFSWPGHSTAPSYALLSRIPPKPGAYFEVTEAAVRALAAVGGAKLASPVQAAPSAPTVTSATAPGQQTDTTVAIIAGGAVALLAVLLLVRAALARPAIREKLSRVRPSPPPALPSLAVVLAIAVATPILVLSAVGKSSGSQQQLLASNPNLDPGTAVYRPAPGFTLDDQFGTPISLQSYRGKVVLLAFNDSECTTVCPLTTTAMLDAKAMLGRAGSQVQLLGVDADPAATSLEDVLSYSELHGLLHQWHFLTGTLAQLRRVWQAYGVEAEAERGEIEHTPALFVIDPDGVEAKVYLTQQSYAAIGQFGKLLAEEASSLLPGHPPVRSKVSYATIPGIAPSASLELPTVNGGRIRLGPGRPRLYVFFATWDQEVTSLGGQLDALDSYASDAAASDLPGLTAVDEASVEPSPGALPTFLSELPRRLSFPIAIDRTGRVADGYGVQGQPWFVLTSASGRILWYWEVSTSGWPSRSALVAYLRSALTRAPGAPLNVAQALAGSPAPLAVVHRQAGQLLGNVHEFEARLRALRGYPVVINAWASWCGPCQAEFGLFASASARYGRHVAFLGFDTEDSPADARAFLAAHPVSYPSYQGSISDLGPLAALEGLPTTIYLDAAGRVVFVHDGQYFSQGILDQDIESYAR